MKFHNHINLKLNIMSCLASYQPKANPENNHIIILHDNRAVEWSRQVTLQSHTKQKKCRHSFIDTKRFTLQKVTQKKLKNKKRVKKETTMHI